MEQQERYPNLSALRAAHRQLLEQRRQDGESPRFLDDVETFIQKGQAAGSLLDNDEERWDAQSLLDYWSNELYHAHRDAPDASLDEYNPDEAPTLSDDLCPYVGLDAFSAAQQDYFYGRSPLIAEMVAHLQENRALMLIGPSGSGKSSAALAGLLPQLQSGALPDSQNWRYLPPLMPGANPLDNLARLLRPDKADDDQWIQDAATRMRESPEQLTHELQQTDDNTPVVLLIDQFEEVFTLCYNDKIRQAFIGNLLHLLRVPAPRHTVILTMRSDFESILVQIPDLFALFEQSQVRIAAMKAPELREVIVKPAEKVGLRFEDGLVDELIHEILGETAALPLLQFTLLKLWENRDRNRVTWEAYRSLGGGRQALAQSADDLYNSLSPAEQATTQQIFLRVVRPDDNLKITRNRILRGELYKIPAPPEQIDQILSRLIQARLLRQTEDSSPDTARIEIAHEALALAWPRLIGWLDEARVAHRRRLRLATMAESWQTRGHDASALLRGLLLEEADNYDDLNEIEEAFVAASRQEAHREQLAQEVEHREKLKQAQALAEEQRQRAEEQRERAKESDLAAKKLRRLALALAIMIVIAGIAAILATSNSQQAEQNAATAVASEALAIIAGGVAQTEANARATAEADALELAATADASASIAEAARADAESAAIAEKEARATAEASASEAEAARADAETQFRLATARELAAAAVDRLGSDPQLGLLLALEAVHFTSTAHQTAPAEAEDALFRAIQASQLQATLSGHSDWALDAAFSPDGSMIATTGLDTAVILWDAQTSQPLHTFTNYTDAPQALNSVAFSPNRQHLAAAGNDGFVYVWDITTDIWRLLPPLGGDGGSVQDIAFNSDGSLLAAAMADKSVRVFDMINHKKFQRLNGHAHPVNAVAFSLESGQLASGDAFGRVIFWNLVTGTEASPDDTLPAESANGEPIAINSLAFSPDGTQLASGLDNSAISVWDVASHTRLATLFGHTSFVFSVAYSEDGRYLASASGDGTAKVWDAHSHQVVYTLAGHNGAVSAVSFDPDGERLVTAGQDSVAKVWDAHAPFKTIYLTGHSAPIYSVAFSADGRFIATGSADESVKIWDGEDGQLLQTITDPFTPVNDVTFSPDGKLVAAVADDQNVWVWALESGERVRVFQRNDAPLNAVRFSPDGNLLAAAGDEGIVQVWEMADGRLIHSFVYGTAVQGLAFHPTEALLAAAGDDGRVAIWDFETGELHQTLIGNESVVNSVAFNRDGSLLATGGSDGAAQLWDMAVGTVRHTFSGHTGAINSVAFSPDGARLATAGSDRTVRLWDIETGQAVRTLLGQASTIHSIAFSPDGRLITAGADRTAQINEVLTLADLFARGQTQATRLLTTEECQQFLRGKDCLMTVNE